MVEQPAYEDNVRALADALGAVGILSWSKKAKPVEFWIFLLFFFFEEILTFFLKKKACFIYLWCFIARIIVSCIERTCSICLWRCIGGVVGRMWCFCWENIEKNGWSIFCSTWSSKFCFKLKLKVFSILFAIVFFLKNETIFFLLE